MHAWISVVLAVVSLTACAGTAPLPAAALAHN
ncbi:MAG: hypothetical protein RJA70_3674, partial [Pseudomonadota bacterium]